MTGYFCFKEVETAVLNENAEEFFLMYFDKRRFPKLRNIKCGKNKLITSEFLDLLIEKRKEDYPSKLNVSRIMFLENGIQLTGELLNKLLTFERLPELWTQKIMFLDLEALTQVDAESFPVIFDHTIMRNVISLNISKTKVTQKSLTVLAKSKMVSNLENIIIKQCENLKPGDLTPLIQSDKFSSKFNVNSLIANTALVDDSFLEFLISSEYLDRLTIVDLNSNRIVSNKGMACFFSDLKESKKTRKKHNIIEIDLSHTLIDKECIEAIANAGLMNLERLGIKNCPFIKSEDIAAAIEKNSFSADFNIEELFMQIREKVDNNVLGALAKSKYIENYRDVYLKSSINVDAEGLGRLLKASKNIDIINIQKCHCDDQIINIITESPAIKNLKALRLDVRAKLDTNGESIRAFLERVNPNMFDIEYFIFDNRHIIVEKILKILAGRHALTEKIKRLNFSKNNNLEPKGVIQFFEGAKLDSLIVLDVSKTKLNDEIFEGIKKNQFDFKKLNLIHIHDSPLFTTKYLHNLLTENKDKLSEDNFSISDNIMSISSWFDDSFLKLLPQVNWAKSLTRLNLKGSTISKEGIKALVKSSCVANLRHLDLNNAVYLDDEGLVSIGESQFLKSLILLEIRGTPLITSKGIVDFIKNNNLSENFDFQNLLYQKKSYINDAVLEAFIDSQKWKDLRALNLQSVTLFTISGLERFLNKISSSEKKVTLHRVNLTETNLDDTILRNFWNIEALRDVRHLNIKGCTFLSSGGLKAFFATYGLDSKFYFDLRVDSALFSDETIEDLSKSKYLENVHTLSFKDNISVTSKSLKTLARF